MIKVVLFDYGGVLSPDGKAGTISELFQEIRDISGTTVNLDTYITPLLHGAMDAEKFLDEVSRHQPEVANKIKDLFIAHILSQDKAVYALAETLRQNHIRTGIFSNVIIFTAEGLKKRGHYDGFDPIILSCEQGMTKPNSEMYKRALAITGVAADEILFIDDQPHNLVPAEALGMHTLLAVSAEQIIREVSALLLIENKLDISQKVKT